MNVPSDVWQHQAPQWERLGPPLRPCAQDHAHIQQVVTEWTNRHGAPRVVVLGATPEMARLSWPEGTDLLAVDRSQVMIDTVWPGFPRPGEGALCANWLSMPLEPASRDLAISDGPFGMLRYPEEYRNLMQSLRRILQPDGLFVFRIFLHPDTSESAGAVYQAALAGRIASFHAFKLRLLMSLQPDTTTGIRTGDVWNAWASEGLSVSMLSDRSGWPAEQITTIEAYRGQDTLYSFPTLQELRAVLTSEGFEEVNCMWPTYELGRCCPTLVYRPIRRMA